MRLSGKLSKDLLSKDLRDFRARLLAWHDAHKRDLPWRRTRDPYRILVSEIMLQQTRVAAAIPYYERFLRRFPTAASLGRARQSTVLRTWAGLGYYSRARNLQAAARQIARHGFPATYEDALGLPGVGPYTAAAVMSIACGQAHAAVDGNVKRVMARVAADNSVGLPDAEVLLDRERPGDFNQAMMELGALVCLPGAPKCEECPVSRHCAARRLERVNEFPARRVKRETEQVRIRWAFVERDGALLLAPPRPDGLWRGFWSLPEIAGSNWCAHPRLLARLQHGITFRDIEIEVYTGQVRAIPLACELVPRTRLKRIPLATPLRKFLKAIEVERQA